MTNKSIVLSVLGAWISAGCGQPSSSLSTANTYAARNNPTVGQVTQASFYVRVYDEGKFTYYLQDRASSFGTECSIAYGSSNKTLNCDLRIAELDLYAQPLKLQFNVPTGMCQYLYRIPFVFYNRVPYYYGANVPLMIDLSTNTCSVNGAAGVFTVATKTCYSSTYGITLSSSGAPTSDYDYSGISGPNCAEGSYISTAIDATGTVTSTKGSFGGAVANCISGPTKKLITNWPSNVGYASGVLSEVSSSGLNDRWDMKSPLEALGTRSNRVIANGFNYQGTFRSGANIHTVGSTGLPTPMIVPYRWDCLDTAFEIKYRINLYIHEFNTVSELTKWSTTSGTTGGSSANPDVTSGCTEEGPTSSCNDVADWDDLTNNAYPQESALD